MRDGDRTPIFDPGLDAVLVPQTVSGRICLSSLDSMISASVDTCLTCVAMLMLRPVATASYTDKAKQPSRNEMSEPHIHMLPAEGGPGGHLFEDDANLVGTRSVRAVLVGYDPVKWTITGVQAKLDDSELLPLHGQLTADSEWIDLAENEGISGISGGYLSVVSYIRFSIVNFVSMSRRWTRYYGGIPHGPTPTTFKHDAPDGYGLIGFYGRAGGAIDQIGGVFRRRV